VCLSNLRLGLRKVRCVYQESILLCHRVLSVVSDILMSRVLLRRIRKERFGNKNLKSLG
jgi:hypothetical protein